MFKVNPNDDKVWERVSQVLSVTTWLIQLQSISDQILQPASNNGWEGDTKEQLNIAELQIESLNQNILTLNSFDSNPNTK